MELNVLENISVSMLLSTYIVLGIFFLYTFALGELNKILALIGSGLIIYFFRKWIVRRRKNDKS